MYYMFFGHCHRTRFRDSFCLASVFEMTVYLLNYLLTSVFIGRLASEGWREAWQPSPFWVTHLWSIVPMQKYGMYWYGKNHFWSWILAEAAELFVISWTVLLAKTNFDTLWLSDLGLLPLGPTSRATAGRTKVKFCGKFGDHSLILLLSQSQNAHNIEPDQLEFKVYIRGSLNIYQHCYYPRMKIFLLW